MSQRFAYVNAYMLIVQKFMRELYICTSWSPAKTMHSAGKPIVATMHGPVGTVYRAVHSPGGDRLRHKHLRQGWG